jgi:hypothetical protein
LRLTHAKTALGTGENGLYQGETGRIGANEALNQCGAAASKLRFPPTISIALNRNSGGVRLAR